MKYIIILGDGMSDFPVAALVGKTPLMVARKPSVDEIARKGRCGTLITIPEGFSTGSDVANLSVLGYDPALCQGRGVIEAASIGVKLTDADVAMRCNLICLENGRIKNHSAGHISTEEAAECIASVQKELGSDEVKFYPGTSYRHLLVFKGFSEKIETFPPHDNVGKKAEAIMVRATAPEAERTAKKINGMIRKSWALLGDHPVNKRRIREGKDPANSIWPWSAGRKPRMKTFQERFKISGAVISAVDLIKGLGIYAGMEVINVEGATGLSDTNYEGKARAALDALNRHDLVYVHTEATDEAGHSRDLALKIKCIEFLDERLVRPILEGLGSRAGETAIAILPDHPTPVERGDHVRAPVPVAIWNPNLTPDAVDRYDEESVLKGQLGHLEKDGFIRTLLGL